MVRIGRRVGAERPKGLADVSAVRTWSYPDYTRVVVELTEPVRLVGDDLLHLAVIPEIFPGKRS